MGLAMVYGIVSNHEGDIEVYSELGQGTSFKAYLPLSQDQVATEIPKIEPKKHSSSGSILLIDDEKVVLDVAEMMLSELGYNVITTQGAEQAIQYYQANYHDVSLVIIDMIMPGMDGKECFKALKKINPRIRAILSTGYGMDGRAQSLLDEGMYGFAQKPYRMEQLGKIVYDALSKSSA